MPILDRETLKRLFRKGSSPTESNFSDLIESTLNKVDDGFDKSKENGLILYPQSTSKKLLSFSENISDGNTKWNLSLNPNKKVKGLSFNNNSGNVCLFLQETGNIGIGTTSPKQTLEVKGMVGMEGRIGTFRAGKADANGEWHTILPKLDGCQMFEITAYAGGQKQQGRYALMHAIAVIAYGGSSPKIRTTQAHYGWWFFNKLQLRWTGETHNYKLQIRTRSNYGKSPNDNPYKISYRIAKLWDDKDSYRPE